MSFIENITSINGVVGKVYSAFFCTLKTMRDLLCVLARLDGKPLSDNTALILSELH